MKEIKCLVIVYSYHHNNTLKIAEEFSKVLNAKLVTTENVNLREIENYDLIAFGAGIDSGKHYKQLLDIADMLPSVNEKSAIIFSTSAIQGDEKVFKDHSALREKLNSKGYMIAGEFSCKGYNTNSFLKYFGGMNKGKPDQTDFENAKSFCLKIKEQTYVVKNA